MERPWYYAGMGRWDRVLAKDKLMTSMQSLGWEHYEVHEPEPHILLFKSVPSRSVQTGPRLTITQASCELPATSSTLIFERQVLSLNTSVQFS